MTIDNETLLLLNAYHDGELSPGEALSMQRRIALEPELAKMLQHLRALSVQLEDGLAPEPAPQHLRAEILASLPEDGADNERRSAPEKRLGATGTRQQLAKRETNWRSIAAALVFGVMVGGAGGYAFHMSQGNEQISIVENEILAAHLRSLIAPQPFDIASSDNHVVKPWFNGKTTIAPIAPDFAAQGFPLVGGRIDVIGAKPVPVLVYRRRQHTISVTVTESADAIVKPTGVINGTNIRRWMGGDLSYWAVSDLNPDELSSFTNLFKTALSGTD